MAVFVSDILDITIYALKMVLNLTLM